MSYQALYRKWRPAAFNEIVGQDAVVTTLKNQIKTGRIGHAYLFCGTRGTGKTSAAKIFARAVNCPHSAEHDGSPCNVCEVCRAISTGRAMNVMEIDAASNNGVDNIRDIRDQVEYPPVTGRYKVYIIDEVHMLSTGAFNALLKTLEEPPSYVIFILATTDPQKIPATVLSRCQRYDFRRMSRSSISGHLKDITERESIRVEDRALDYIAEAADGSMRDSLSLLDQCLAYHYGEILTYENVLEILGAADDSMYSGLFECIMGSDIEGALALADELITGGCEINQLINDFIWYLRNVLLAKSLGGKGRADVSEERAALFAKDAELADRERLIGMIISMSELANRLRLSSQKRVQLETELIRECVPELTAAVRTARQPDVRLNQDGTGAGSALIRDKRTPPEDLKSDSGQSVRKPEEPALSQRVPVSARISVEISDIGEGGRETDGNGSGSSKGAAGDEARTAPRETDTVRNAAPPQESGELRTGCSSEGIGAIDIVRKNWSALIGELSASNRPLFSGVALKEERGGIVLLFRNKMNYTLAAKNSEENGVLRLRELAQTKLGLRVSFMARIARPGEIDPDTVRATDEELARINFPISIED